jgi:uncharacterized protein YaeQ
VWWQKHGAVLTKLPRLSVRQVGDSAMHALAAALQPGMTLQCTIQDGDALLSWETDSVVIVPRWIKTAGA